jgi:hypothetical protein
LSERLAIEDGESVSTSTNAAAAENKNHSSRVTPGREIAHHRIDELKELLIVVERRGAFAAESPGREIDAGDPWNLIRLKPA